MVSQADDLRDEALRKIGRNIVNLQKMGRAASKRDSGGADAGGKDAA